MNTYIGIDVGTSSVKLLLVNEKGEVLSSQTEKYPVYNIQEGFSEQDPHDWMDAVSHGVLSLLDGADKKSVKGISFGGQMHGLVALDKFDRVIRPCILWNDSRAEKETRFLNEKVGKETLSRLTANVAFAGFTAPKLLWMKKNEPDNFSRISKIMLPKDYISYCLTGVFATDFSDASGTLLLDVKNRCWSEEMCSVCDVRKEWLPCLYESHECTGALKAYYRELWGLEGEVKVAIGAGDNAAAAIGVGAVRNGDCSISLGTSGTVFICNDAFQADPCNALHSFCHANGLYHLMGCILTAASARKWWLEDILHTLDYEADDAAVECETNIIFLPYLCGERSPHNDVNARGAFIGLSNTTKQAEISRAVLEGVAFALRDCLEVAKRSGLQIGKAKLCGGGAKSAVWRQVIADVLGIPIDIPLTEQGPAYGASVLAMVCCGEYDSIEAAAEKLAKVKETVLPNDDRRAAYQKKYSIFRALYPAIRSVYTDRQEQQ